MRVIKAIDANIPKDDWLKIWNDSVSGHLSDKVRETTWERLMDDDVPLFGLMAYDDRVPVGFMHYALHPISGAIEPAAYMQDLFVLPKFRRRGYARSMMNELIKIGQNEQWDRVLWVVDHGNDAAQKLYENYGTALDFNFYIYPIAMLKRLMN